MATRTGTFKNIARGVIEAKWTGFSTASDIGTALDGSQFPDKTVQVFGTFAGGTIVIEGSNDGGTNYHTLNDSRGEGNALSFTAADTRQMLENPGKVRPKLTVASGATSLSVIIYCQSAKR